MLHPPASRCWAEIAPSALRHNLHAARALQPAGTRIMAIVKANGYGHGVAHVVQALRGEADLFGVANVTEALEVRRLDPETPIFLLGPALPEERGAIVEHGFIPALSTLEEGEAFAALGEARGRPVEAHLAVDTGMGRIGVWEAEALEVARGLAGQRGLKITGIASHLPCADEDSSYTSEQLQRFHALVAELRGGLLPGAAVHVDNSAGIMAFPALAGDITRPGLMLYGSSPLPEFQSRLRPALTWKTQVTLLREVGPGRGVSYGRTFITPHAMRLATLAVGYADGFRRHLTHRGTEVLLGGRRCALLGRVTMDQIVVDVTKVPGVKTGDEAVLLGRQGGEEILAAEHAERAGTIAWDIFTGLGPRVRRVVVEQGVT